MSPVYYRDLLLCTWWLLALLAILADLTVCFASIIYFPVYQVSTCLEIDFRYPPPGSIFYPPLGLTIAGNATTLLTTEAQLAVSPGVLATVAAENPGVDASRLRSHISVNAIANDLDVAESAAGRCTLLVDAQLARGQQSRNFDIPPAPGLSDAVLDLPQVAPGGFSLLRYARRPGAVNAPQLLVLPSGTPPPNPYPLLSSRAMDRLLASLEQVDAERIILDTPPLLGDPRMARAASVLLRQVDGVLLVVDLEHTRKDHLLRTQRLLASTGVRVLGCVVTGGPMAASVDDSDAARRSPHAVLGTTYRDISPGGTLHDE